MIKERVHMKRLYIIAIVLVVVATVALIGTFLLLRTESPFTKVSKMQIGNEEIGVLLLGDSTVVLKTSSHTLIVDPATRISSNDVKALGKVDAILITHEHGDHFNAGTTSQLQQASGAVVVANKGAYQGLEGLILESGKMVELEPEGKTGVDGIVIEAVLSNHGGTLPLMYIITADGITIFHGSDSGFNPSLEQYAGKIDIAFVPTGGPSPTASPQEAYSITATLRPKKLIPIHGTSDQNSEFRNLVSDISGVSFVEADLTEPIKVSV